MVGPGCWWWYSPTYPWTRLSCQDTIIGDQIVTRTKWASQLALALNEGWTKHKGITCPVHGVCLTYSYLSRNSYLLMTFSVLHLGKSASFRHSVLLWCLGSSACAWVWGSCSWTWTWASGWRACPWWGRGRRCATAESGAATGTASTADPRRD